LSGKSSAAIGQSSSVEGCNGCLHRLQRKIKVLLEAFRWQASGELKPAWNSLG